MICTNTELKLKIRDGINKAAQPVIETAGPNGKNVILDDGATITNDGVSIIKEIELEDEVENVGANILKQVAIKVNEIAGDGTTGSIILTKSLYNNGLEYTLMGVSAMEVRNSIHRASQAAISMLEKSARKVENIEDVARVSSESEYLGKIISDVFRKIGKDGVVTVEQSPKLGVEVEIKEGLEFNNGFLSPYMVTNLENSSAELNDIDIMFSDKSIDDASEFLQKIKEVQDRGRNEMLVVARDVRGKALDAIVQAAATGGFKVVAVKAPGMGEEVVDQLEDLKSLVKDGRFCKVTVTQDKTTIVTDGSAKERIKLLKRKIENEKSEYTKTKLKERIAKLTSSVAILSVGAASVSEMQYLKLKIEDAINATRAALEDGVVAGGGCELLRIAYVLGGKKEVGYQLMAKALEAPFRQIAENSDLEAGVIISNILAGKSGYDALNKKYVDDMFLAGIVDPLKVIKTAIEVSVSAVGTLLTTNSLIYEHKNSKSEAK